MTHVSQQLRNHRKRLGLSLTQLARRADTSPATLSRYENGWARFELYTLRKLATALGCRLVVRLEPRATSREPVTREEAVRGLQRLFWDHTLCEGDLEKYPSWVLERVLEYGSLEDVRLLVNLLGRSAFLEMVCQARFSSAKTRNFWKLILEKEGLACTRKFSRNTAWSC